MHRPAGRRWEDRKRYWEPPIRSSRWYDAPWVYVFVLAGLPYLIFIALVAYGVNQ